MPARKMNAKQREQHMAVVADLYQQRLPMIAIAERTGVSYNQIQYDVTLLRKAWAETRRQAGEDWIAAQLARIDWLEKEATEAWERSKQERETTSTERTVRPRRGLQIVGTTQPAPTEQVDKAAVKRYHRDGNPEFWDKMLACVDLRCKILGLYAQQPQVQQQVNIQIVGVNPEDI